MRKKITKIICWMACIAFLCGAVYFLTAFFGNPISPVLAKSSAEKYLSENHADQDFVIEKIYYDLKSGGYNANIVSPTSRDSYFTICFDALGRYKYDTYDAIINGSNTYSRLDSAYRALVDEALDADCPLDVSIGFGELTVAGLYEVFTYVDEAGETASYTLDKNYGLDVSALTLDGDYDIVQLGSEHGRIILYIHDPILTTQRTAELLLEVAAYLDARQIPFHAIEFHHCEPRNEEGQNVGGQITLYNFLHSDIYEEDLLSRVEEYWAVAQEHHAIQDGEKVNSELLYLKEFVIPGE